MPTTEATLTMAPACRRAIRDPTSRQTTTVPRRSTAISRSQSDIASRDGGCILPRIPAALTSPTIRPCRRSIFSQAPATAASSETSTVSGNTATPGADSVLIRAARSSTTTRHPFAAAAAAVAAPMPLRPPVTTTMPATFVWVIAFPSSSGRLPFRRDQRKGVNHLVDRRSRPPRHKGLKSVECSHRHVLLDANAPHELRHASAVISEVGGGHVLILRQGTTVRGIGLNDAGKRRHRRITDQRDATDEAVEQLGR